MPLYRGISVRGAFINRGCMCQCACNYYIAAYVPLVYPRNERLLLLSNKAKKYSRAIYSTGTIAHSSLLNTLKWDLIIVESLLSISINYYTFTQRRLGAYYVSTNPPPLFPGGPILQ